MTNAERDAQFEVVFDGVRTLPLVTSLPFSKDAVCYRRRIVRTSRDTYAVSKAKAWLDARGLPYLDGTEP